MSISASTLRNRLNALKKDGKLNITRLHEVTGISRNSIYGFLDGAIPDLDTLDKLAKALGEEKPWQLIQPEEDKSNLEKLLSNETLKKLMPLIEVLSKHDEKMQKNLINSYITQAKSFLPEADEDEEDEESSDKSESG